jgi:hypothetical protein
MPTPTQQSNVSSAIMAIRSAQNILRQQINASSDTMTAIKLTSEYSNLDSNLSQLLHAQNATDDASFTNAVAALKSPTSALQADQATIKKEIADVKTAASVVSYITQAIGFIAKV